MVSLNLNLILREFSMKILLLYLIRAFGFFKLAKRIKRKELLILAYHGVAINDEGLFSPELFISMNTLEKRMNYLKKKNFHVLSLEVALEKLNSGILPDNSIVITVDDGWFSTMYAHQIFSNYKYPYTVYVTSYYVLKEVPVLNVLLNYMLWSYGRYHSKINFDSLGIKDIRGDYAIQDLNIIVKRLVSFMNSFKNTDQKIEFIKKLSNLLQFNYESIEKERNFNLLTPLELKDLSEKGVDIQLHTHRHQMPLNDENVLIDEINDNRSILSAYVKNNLNHFCYPSGIYNLHCERLLKNRGIKSATTCEPGFITKQTNLYYLPRFLDSEHIHQIVFEAEVSGVLDLFRKIKKFVFRERNEQV
jgi:peptidoglycan/xylan/chitin deacetylase (PgdA/CDA1 family)